MKETRILLIVVITFMCLVFLMVPGSSQPFNFRTAYNLDLAENGSAHWSIENRVPLANDEEVKEFERYMENFSNEREQKLGLFINDTRQIIEQAEKATDREMSGKNFDVEVNKIESITGDSVGLVSYEFIWVNFSQKQGNELKIGDVFVGGLSLGENDSLSIRYPQNRSVKSITPSPSDSEDNKLVWVGPKNFNPETPSVSLVEVESNGEAKNSPQIMLIAAFLISIVVLFAIYLYKRRNKPGKPKKKIRSDEQIILDLIKENDGEIYQKEIVEQTDFSKAKVSNLLKRLDEKDEIKKIQRGRKNLIRLN